MVNRSLYVSRIKRFIDKPFIKVITGIRRSGKSTVLMLLKEELQKAGISDGRIVYLNFESFAHSSIDTASALYQYMNEKIGADNKTYVILDEIQEVKQWEKAVNSIFVDFNVDIYITGSNSHLLSSELATYLAGRYVTFHIYPLSFREYLFFKEQRGAERTEIHSEFEFYLRMGGFPVLHTGEYTLETAYKIVEDIYSSVILRDTVQRNNIRDIELLERIVRYVFDNLGNKFSGKNVADYFKSQQRKLDINTVYNYLNALESAFIIHRAYRFDVKGKEILKTQEKFYLADPALLYALVGYKDRAISGVMENIVMLELKRREYNVYVGKMDVTEIDFVASKGSETVYVQVSYLLSEQSTIDREFSPLLKIKDNFPKYVVTMDRFWKDNIQGIRHLHISDFLLLEKFE